MYGNRRISVAIGSFLSLTALMPAVWANPLPVPGQNRSDPIRDEAAKCSAELGKGSARSVAICRQAAALARKGGQADSELSSLAALTVSLIQLGQYGDVPEPSRRAIQLADQLGAFDLAILMRHQAGFSCYWLNDYGCATDFFKQALEIEKKYPRPSMRRLLLGSLGDVHFYLGQMDEAQDSWRASLYLARQNSEAQAETAANIALGGIAYQRGETNSSERYMQSALQQARKNGQKNLEANALSALGRLALDRKQTMQARSYMNAALEIYRSIGNHYNSAVMYRSLAELALQKGQPKEAVRGYRASLELARNDQEQYGIAESLAGLGVAQFKQGNLQEAERSLRESIVVQEGIRGMLGPRDAMKISLFETQASPYEALQAVLVRMGRPLDALVIAERGRARAYVDMMLAHRSPAPRFPGGEVLSLQAIRGVAQQQQATLVNYSVLPGQLLIWVIPPRGEIVFHRSRLDTTGPQSLASLVAKARNGLGDPTNTTLRELHRVLVEPVLRALPPKPDEPVVIIPHKELFLVPFAALEGADGTRLIDQHTLLNSPSVQVLQLLARRPRESIRSGTALVVGNPWLPARFRGRGDTTAVPPPLPESEREARVVGALLGVSPLLGVAATETEVRRRLPTADVVHLATHGFLDQGDGEQMPGSMALADSPEDDGRLTATEISRMSIQANLVVLSACDTGRGRLTGDGVVGLSRAWLGAGATQVVVSLWSVPDASTSSLMEAFHRGRLRGVSPAAALREAMRQERTRHRDPLSWAGFIVMGPAR
jgi:CHAT domain-containing protein/tetratricopeptide (TPR) repeat protein